MLTTSVSRNSDLNSGTSTYTISLTQKPEMEASSYLYITFPSKMELTSSTACTELDGSTPLTCSYSNNILTVNLGSSVISSLSQFGVIASNIINPPSF